MLERINGFSESGILGYFYGKNALVSIAIDSTSNVNVLVTGAVCSYVGLTHFLNTEDKDEILAFLNEKGVTRIDGTEFVLATLEADYTASYAAQTNVKRIIDIVQQRAVILSTSEIANSLTVTGFENELGTLASMTSGSVVTFLVERANVFDKDVATFQGVPTTTIEQGRLLIDDLTGIALLDSTGAEVRLASASTAATAGNFATKIYYSIPAYLG